MKITGKSGQVYELPDGSTPAEIKGILGADYPSPTVAPTVPAATGGTPSGAPEQGKNFAPSTAAFLIDRAKAGLTQGVGTMVGLGLAAGDHAIEAVTGGTKTPFLTKLKNGVEAGTSADLPINKALGVQNFDPRSNTERYAGVAVGAATDLTNLVAPGAGAALKATSTAVPFALKQGALASTVGLAATGGADAAKAAGAGALGQTGSSLTAGLAAAILAPRAKFLSPTYLAARGSMAIASKGQALFGENSRIGRSLGAVAAKDAQTMATEVKAAKEEAQSAVASAAQNESSYRVRSELDNALKEADASGRPLEAVLADQAKAAEVLGVPVPPLAASSENIAVRNMTQTAMRQPEVRGAAMQSLRQMEEAVPEAISKLQGTAPSDARASLAALEPNSAEQVAKLETLDAAKQTNAREAVNGVLKGLKDLPEQADDALNITGQEIKESVKTAKAKAREAMSPEYEKLHAQARDGVSPQSEAALASSANSLKQDLEVAFKDTVGSPSPTLSKIAGLVEQPLNPESVNSIKKSLNDLIRLGEEKRAVSGLTDIERSQLQAAKDLKGKYFGVDSPNNLWDRFSPELGKQYRELDKRYQEVTSPFRVQTISDINTAGHNTKAVKAIISNAERAQDFLRATGTEGLVTLEKALLSDLHKTLSVKSIGTDTTRTVTDWIQKHQGVLSSVPSLMDKTTDVQALVGQAYMSASDTKSKVASIIKADILAGSRAADGTVTTRTANPDAFVDRMLKNPNELGALVSQYGHKEGVLNAVKSIIAEKAFQSSDPVGYLTRAAQQNKQVATLMQSSLEDTLIVMNAVQGMRGSVSASDAGFSAIAKDAVQAATGMTLSTMAKTLAAKLYSPETKGVRIAGSIFEKKAQEAEDLMRLTIALDPAALKAHADYIRKNGVTNENAKVVKQGLTAIMQKANDAYTTVSGMTKTQVLGAMAKQGIINPATALVKYGASRPVIGREAGKAVTAADQPQGELNTDGLDDKEAQPLNTKGLE